MKDYFLFLLLASTYTTVVTAQDATQPTDFKEDAAYLREKVFLHLDKSYYNAGENLWFKAYRLNAGTHQQESMKGVVYVDIIGIDGVLVASRIIKVGKGFGQGDFVLPLDLESGEYMVRAYTRYMRNFEDAYFFRKKIYIEALPKTGENLESELVNTTDTSIKETHIKQLPDLQFFPEGGNMVNDIFNHIGFKVLNPNGKSMEISGIIVDDEGVKVAEFRSTKFGMGRFSFKPLQGKQYSANILYKGNECIYNLPIALDKGTLIQVQDLRDKYQVNVQTTDPQGLMDFELLVSQRKGFVYTAKISENKKTAVIRIPKDQLSVGIAQFTLLNSKGIPIAERLAFNQEGVFSNNIAIASSSSNYAKDVTAELDIRADLTGFKTKDFGADLSVSVTEVAVAQPLEHQLDIRTYLLLNSELKGKIEQAGYYFNSDDPKRSQNLDLLMMTQGWRQFIMDAQPVSNSFPYEKGITIEGDVMVRPKEKTVSGAYVSLTYWDESGIGKNKVITDEDGHFKFLSLDFIDKSGLILEAKDYKRSSKKLFVVLDSLTYAPVTATFVHTKNLSGMEYKNYMELPEERERINRAFADENGLIKLDEVVVKSWAKKMIDKRELVNSLHRNASKTIEFQSTGRGRSFPTIMDAMQGAVAGLQIYNNTVAIRGTNSRFGNTDPLYLLDGMEVDFNALKFIAPWEVDFVDILKGGDASIYGSKGMNGVFAVYTITSTFNPEEKLAKNADSYKHQGFYPARKFYEPEVDSDVPDLNKKYSSTLYWEPNVRLDNTGKSKVSFPTGTRPGSYKVMVQGITQDGTPVSSETVFEIN